MNADPFIYIHLWFMIASQAAHTDERPCPYPRLPAFIGG
jgi:hypothetical protein